MGKLDRTFISIIVFSLAISAGVVTQATESGQDKSHHVAQDLQSSNVQLVDARYLPQARGDAHSGSAQTEKNLYPTTIWVLGSALLAMVGYKRMRNNITGTD